ncbi:hypothetical protein DVH24_006981 [Malus domestica]|uniref:Uncharacterized protein n=1 Tax=Malus domestica TaxID=3750 RepID=A0A498IBF8_MALDO|nr:hypothetical protein DVH24_006981 [Malus domestica]
MNNSFATRARYEDLLHIYNYTKKNNLSHRGLCKILGKRQRFLSYLSKKNIICYKELINRPCYFSPTVSLLPPPPHNSSLLPIHEPQHESDRLFFLLHFHGSTPTSSVISNGFQAGLQRFDSNLLIWGSADKLIFWDFWSLKWCIQDLAEGVLQCIILIAFGDLQSSSDISIKYKKK